MSTLAVSSFSLRQQLGPVRIGYRDASGAEQEFVLPYPSLISIKEFAALVRERFDADAIEICQIQWQDPTDAEVQQLASALRDAGVELLNIPIDVGDLASPDAGRRGADIAATLRWLDIAAALGARFARVNAGAALAGAERDEDALVAALRLLGDAAAERGVRLLVENHGGQSSDPVYLQQLLKQVGRDRLGLLLDLGNFEPMLTLSRAGMSEEEIDPSALDFEPLYAAIESLVAEAELVHAKSFGSVTPTVANPFDTERALKIVADSGYSGPITIEYEGEEGDPWVKTGELVDLLRHSGSALN
jgi:sugar phosphate isomerase/epimerase